MSANERPAAEATHQDVFRHLDAVIEQVHSWLHAEPIPSAGTALDNLQLAFIVRALNQYRGILVLLRNNHWEDALILTRALFELVLNLEELVHRQQDKEAAAERFFLFSSLQQFLEKLELRRYNVHSGRLAPEHAKELEALEGAARKLFVPFAYFDKKRRPRWRTHWANRTVADLCNLSSNKMRRHQYQLLYARGSAFTHSTPTAVLSAHAPGPTSFEEFIQYSEEQEERNLRMVASFATLFVGDVLVLTGERLPRFRPEWVAQVLVPAASAIITGWTSANGDAG